MGAHRATRGGLSAAPANPASLARSTFSRQTPEVEAECLNRARSVLCGGRAAVRVPTAIAKHRQAFDFSTNAVGAVWLSDVPYEQRRKYLIWHMVRCR